MGIFINQIKSDSQQMSIKRNAAFGLGILSLIGVALCSFSVLLPAGRLLTCLGPLAIFWGIVINRGCEANRLAGWGVVCGGAATLFLPTLFLHW